VHREALLRELRSELPNEQCRELSEELSGELSSELCGKLLRVTSVRTIGDSVSLWQESGSVLASGAAAFREGGFSR
jgi:hypothetical protein